MIADVSPPSKTLFVRLFFKQVFGQNMVNESQNMVNESTGLASQMTEEPAPFLPSHIFIAFI